MPVVGQTRMVHFINAAAGDLSHPFLIVNIINDLPHNPDMALASSEQTSV